MERHRIDKAALRETITSLEGLTNEQKADLLQLLSEQKRYGLVWEDHAEDVEEQLRTQLPVLCEDSSKRILSADEKAPNHILIEGDNLHALTALTYTHEGKVDVIYIDPPYNTGNKDFVYNDSFVDSEDGYRHSKWLSFMHKRLKIAKRLLSDRGVIFISIDDNEQANLKLLCDEVFGANNFIACFIKPLTGGKAPYFVKRCHEYLLCYMNNSCNITDALKNRQEKQEKATTRSLRKDGDSDRREDRPDMYYCIYADVTNNSMSLAPFEKSIPLYPLRPDGTDGRWRWGKEKFSKEKDRLIIKKKKNGEYDVQVITEEGTIREYPWESIIKENTSGGGIVLNNILGDNTFSYPKNVDYIVWILSTITKQDSLILDFFAGSGTTLHATMQLNAEDGGHRQCILVTNNENGICENVTYERNRRVIQGYTTPKGVEVPGLSGNNLRYYRTDFVERETTRTAKRQLMMASTELLCIKHDVYDEQPTFGSITLRPTIARYFTGGKQQMLIIYRTEAIESLVAEIAEMPESTNILVYVFSTTNYAMDADFEEVSDKVTLCALPAAIYNAYLRVLPKRSFAKDDALRYDDDALRYDDNALDDDALRYDDDNDNDNMGGTEA